MARIAVPAGVTVVAWHATQEAEASAEEEDGMCFELWLFGVAVAFVYDGSPA